MSVRTQSHVTIAGRALLWAALLAAPTTRITAQEAPRVVRIEGVAFDSLSNRPLPDAFVAVAGTGRSATSDTKGRFRLDSVPEGEHTLTMQHAAFDSLGLSGASVRVVVRNRMPRVVLAVPSFATLWRVVCGDTPAPPDSALIYGTVKSPDGTTAIGQGLVEVSWVDLVGGGTSLTSIGQRRWRRTTESDDRGEFALCGVAAGVPLQMRIAPSPKDTSAFTTLQLEATTARVRRRDVRMAPPPTVLVDSATQAAGDSTIEAVRAPMVVGNRVATPPTAPSGLAAGVTSGTVTGTVTGIVTNAGGVPLENAVIAVDTLAEVRSGPDGRFRVAAVGAGTRQALVVAVGMSPQTVTMDVLPGGTTPVVITMQPVQLLDAVRVRANASTVAGMRRLTYEEHRRTGMGDFRDSTDFVGQNSIITALRMIPGVSVRVGRGAQLLASSASCAGFRLVLDGHPTSAAEVFLLQPADLAAMEVYKRRLIYPSDAGPCTIFFWTKGAFGR